MITTLIGKTFLKAYNDKYNKDYSAKEFFEEVYFELFFNHPKYMQWVTNSPFVQGITTDDDGFYGKEIGKEKLSSQKGFEDKFNQAIIDYGRERVSIKTEKSKGTIKIILKNDKVQRIERLNKFHSNIASGTRDGSVAIGYAAAEDDDFGTYSGLVTNINLDTTSEDVYNSWIGSGLGIGVAGGYSIFLDDSDILLFVFEGWKYYRKYLNDPTLDRLSGNKINSWNGQWLTYRLGKDYDDRFDFRVLEDNSFFKIDKTDLVIETVNWSNLFFSLSNKYPGKILNSYICSLGDKNQTIGFIPIYLKAGKRLIDVFSQLFHTDLPFNNKDFQSLFGMHIKRACELGNIGLQALRPESIKKYMEDSKNISFKKEEDNLIYQSYKTWLIAMISKNKEQITDYTTELAKLILRYVDGSTKTDRKNLINNDLLGAKSKKGFIDALTEMIKGIDMSNIEALKKLKDEVHLMSNEEFGYFNTLLKFDYAFEEKQSKNLKN
jgi:hypothetical protein